MQLLFISTLLAALSMPTAAHFATEYGQCGGEEWKGTTVCSAGFECIERDEYYSQCMPKAVDTSLFVPRYSQCGGKKWTGLTTCVEGSKCVASDKYYAQCRPDSEKTPSLRTL